MYLHPLQVSMDTLMGVSPMLGYRLEDRQTIRDAQDRDLLQYIQTRSAIPFTNRDQEDLFCVAPLDVLVSETKGEKRFHIIEINGTGIGGLTNMTEDAIASVLDDLQTMARKLPGPAPLVIVAVSGMEADQLPRLNKLIHEKVFYCEAIKRGFELAGHQAAVLTLSQIVEKPSLLHNDCATVVLGYIKEFLGELQLQDQGGITLAGRQVTGAVNDRFCLNLLQQFDHRVDLNRLTTMNRCFMAGADKGIAYSLLNDFASKNPEGCFANQVKFARVFERKTLIATVLDWVQGGLRTVIKPQGTGLGHGIEFFLDANEKEADMVGRIDRSLQLTEKYYKVGGGAFPYTLCEFVDTCTIGQRDHHWFGHKYELRIVVYRDGRYLKPFPSIVKVASGKYDPRRFDVRSLINNITASTEATQSPGTEFMLPLTNRDTLKLLGLHADQLIELCKGATGFIRYTLDRVQSEPKFFGLPRSVPVRRPQLLGVA